MKKHKENREETNTWGNLWKCKVIKMLKTKIPTAWWPALPVWLSAHYPNQTIIVYVPKALFKKKGKTPFYARMNFPVSNKARGFL